MLHPLDPHAGSALLLLATSTQDDSAAQPAGQEPTSSRQTHWQGRDEEPSVRCRMSGICDGAPPPGSCADSPPPEYRSLGAAERDVVLACITDPGQRAAEIAEAAAWSWQGYRRVGLGARVESGRRALHLCLSQIDTCQFAKHSTFLPLGLNTSVPGLLAALCLLITGLLQRGPRLPSYTPNLPAHPCDPPL